VTIATIGLLKRLVMEVVPNAPGRKTHFDTIFNDVGRYCSELGYEMTELDLDEALDILNEEQSICVFNRDDIRPTNHGLVKYEQL
jgi:hypothetical protein